MKEEKNLAVVNKKPLKTRIFQYRWFYVMFMPVLIFVLVEPLDVHAYQFGDTVPLYS
jgi:hypothetical protein